jgi:acetyl-CoA carboxylase biotin carboxyl carrier protein
MKDITLEEIIDRFEDSSLSELDVSFKDLHVICKRYANGLPNSEDNVAFSEPPVKKTKTKRVIEGKSEEVCNDVECFNTITSPLVGTFYTAPSPDSPPFVKKGDKVKKGDTLCILEAMKMMNELTAEEDCTIEEILIPEAALVEFGQPLFKVKN